MLRFASSPIRDMHISDLRVAIFNYLVAKQKNEDFIVRIEDMDREKNIEGKDNEILDLLNLFGLEYSQVIYQSEQIRFHSAMALQLMHDKKAFSCFCSDNWIENKRQEAKNANETYKYDDACRDLHPELVIDNTNPFRIRINQPLSSSIDSFIIMNQNKTPKQVFSSAVDDMLSNISHVVCNQEQKNDSLKQEHIRAMLNYDKKVEYIYLPTLSNNNDSSNIKLLLEEGFLPDAIANYLIVISCDTPKEIFTLKEALVWFDIEKISSSPTHFDWELLKNINREHLKNLDAKELSRYVGFADISIGNLAKVYLEKEVSTTKELREKIAPIFAPKEIDNEFKESAKILKESIKQAPYFEEYEEFYKYVLNDSSLDEETFRVTLRLLLTGEVNGIEIADLYKYLKDYLGEIVK